MTRKRAWFCCPVPGDPALHGRRGGKENGVLAKFARIFLFPFLKCDRRSARMRMKQPLNEKAPASVLGLWRDLGFLSYLKRKLLPHLA